VLVVGAPPFVGVGGCKGVVLVVGVPLVTVVGGCAGVVLVVGVPLFGGVVVGFDFWTG
jgi:hypothetical protein